MSERDILQVKLFANTILLKLKRLEKEYTTAKGGKKRVICNNINEMKKFLSGIGIGI